MTTTSAHIATRRSTGRVLERLTVGKRVPRFGGEVVAASLEV